MWSIEDLSWDDQGRGRNSDHNILQHVPTVDAVVSYVLFWQSGARHGQPRGCKQWPLYITTWVKGDYFIWIIMLNVGLVRLPQLLRITEKCLYVVHEQYLHSFFQKMFEFTLSHGLFLYVQSILSLASLVDRMHLKHFKIIQLSLRCYVHCCGCIEKSTVLQVWFPSCNKSCD